MTFKRIAGLAVLAFVGIGAVSAGMNVIVTTAQLESASEE